MITLLGDKTLQERFDVMQDRVDKMNSKLQPLSTRLTTMESHGELPNPVHLSLSSHSNHLSASILTQETRPGMIPKSCKLAVPRFDGTDPLCWTFKINQFFQLHNTLKDQRITITPFHTEGPDLSWFEWMQTMARSLPGKIFYILYKYDLGIHILRIHKGLFSNKTTDIGH